MGLSYAVKPQEEKIKVYRSRYSDLKICQNPKCKREFRVLLAYYNGSHLIRQGGKQNQKYCSPECRYQAMLKRMRERSKKQGKDDKR